MGLALNEDAFGQASAESFGMILLVPEILGMVNIYHPPLCRDDFFVSSYHPTALSYKMPTTGLHSEWLGFIFSSLRFHDYIVYFVPSYES